MDDCKHVPGIWIEDRVSITQRRYDELNARIAELERERDALRAEIARLTTLRPMSELTQEDGKVLIHPISGKEAHATDVSEMRFTAIECGLGEGQAWREHYRGWAPIPEAKP